MFIALRHLKKCNIIHADIKPDNMLVNDKLNILKICDFGSATSVAEMEITPYLVSRFYRAPEIILGLPYDTSADMWSVACTIFELYTGKILFQGTNNNDMLRLQMEVKGAFPKKLVRKAQFKDQHFDSDLVFEQHKIDAASNQLLKRKITFTHPIRSIDSLLQSSIAGKLTPSESKRVSQLKDLLEKGLALDPQHRLSPEDALRHPFLSD
eukprot:TRINITY_DN2161_c0_g2_i10.p1 TRINITY_DN2161_c0_g2~~TRINITY_DN2161_c0_g2_i10.p1  ORF type:complete len:210 (-),score=31.75 TRINITY_DN2161_c0_g2_i10:83-712(-)